VVLVSTTVLVPDPVTVTTVVIVFATGELGLALREREQRAGNAYWSKFNLKIRLIMFGDVSKTIVTMGSRKMG
jgi:hypothetical protein